MKKLINRPERVVEEMLEGLLVIHPGLARLSRHNVIVRADAEQARNTQVSIVSGGGSGHEPAHAGFVGAGMLNAAVAGEVFTSPSVEAVLAAIKAVTGEPGVLLVVKNYTGDRLNFGLAAEMARAEGIRTETVLVADDIALRATHQSSSSRGIAGTVLVHKIAGAASAEGMSLDAVAKIARSAAEDIASMGLSLSAGIVPASGKPTYILGEQEVELGLGIHGEPGVRKVFLRTADEHADELVEAIFKAHSLEIGNRVALLVNNLGATTTMELAIVARRVVTVLESRGISVERVYAGTFMSSLDAAGISVSVMRVDEERLRLLDAPTSAPAWPRVSLEGRLPLAARTIGAQPDRQTTGATLRPGHTALHQVPLHQAIEAACRAIVTASDSLTELDRAVGDGDLGVNLARGAKDVQAMLTTDSSENMPDLLLRVAEILQRAVAGSSGPFYSVLLLRAANTLRSGDSHDPKLWARACRDGCNAISEIGGAAAGDRTMLDALLPFVRALNAAFEAGQPLSEALADAAAAAEEGAQATTQMLPRRGRSSYLGDRCLGHPDPGAVAVAIWLRAVANSISGRA